jgi:hypothetical protein
MADNNLRLYSFVGGLNLLANNFALKEDEATTCRNVVFDEQGALVKRKGYTSILDSVIPDDITGLYAFHEKDGTRHLLATAGGYIYEIDESAGTYSKLNIGVEDETFTSDFDTAVSLEYNNIKSGSVVVTTTDGTTTYTEDTDYTIDYDNGTITVLSSGTMNSNTDYNIDYYHAYNITADEPVSFTTWGNTCFISNGVDPLLEYNGTEIVINDAAPKGKYIVAHNNYLFIAGNSTYPSRLYYSELADPDDWTGTDGIDNVIEVATDDGDKITGISRQAGNLVIFKTNSIHILYGSVRSQFTLKEAMPNIGCIAPRSIVNIYNRLYFLYRDGIYKFNGSDVEYISEKVKPKINLINNVEEVSGAWYDHHYYLSYAEGASESNNRVLVFDILHEAWSYFTGMNIEMWNNFDGSQDGQVNLNTIYFADSTEGQIHNFLTGTDDDGDSIDMRYTTKYFDFQSPEMIKEFRHLQISNISQGDFYLDYDIDKGSKSGTAQISGYKTGDKYYWGLEDWGTLEWNESTIKRYGKSLRSGAYGSNIAFTFRDNSTNSVRVLGLTVDVRQKRRRYQV